VLYPLDVLNRFHTTMEQIVKPASTMGPEAVDGSVRQRFQKLLRLARETWSEVRAADFQAPYYSLNEKQREQLAPLIQAEAEALDRLGEALRREDPAGILQAAKAIKPGFARIYMLFGDFPGGPPAGGKPAG
jgi:hypothetical protein